MSTRCVRAAAFALAAALVAVPAFRAEDAAKKDIVTTAVSAGNFKTLAKALEAAGLVDALKGKGPFTVFAPTDDAFAKIPQDTLEALLKDKEKLTAILKYHVVDGSVKAEKIATLNGQSVKTLQGDSIKIDVDGSTVKVNDAKVTKTDIECSNGVIHVIDTVIMPPAK